MRVIVFKSLLYEIYISSINFDTFSCCESQHELISKASLFLVTVDIWLHDSQGFCSNTLLSSSKKNCSGSIFNISDTYLVLVEFLDAAYVSNTSTALLRPSALTCYFLFDFERYCLRKSIQKRSFNIALIPCSFPDVIFNFFKLLVANTGINHNLRN